jgi:hypothetical protein
MVSPFIAQQSFSSAQEGDVVSLSFADWLKLAQNKASCNRYAPGIPSETISRPSGLAAR